MITATYAYNNILPDLFKLYSTRDHNIQVQLLRKYMTNDVTFEDPIVKVKSAEKYRLQFHSLIKLFREIKVEFTENDVSIKSPSGTLNGPNSFDIEVLNTQKYWMSGCFGTKEYCFKVKTVYSMVKQKDKEFVVVKHQDFWLNENFLTKFGFYQQHLKPFVGGFTCLFFKLIGW